MIIGFKKV